MTENTMITPDIREEVDTGTALGCDDIADQVSYEEIDREVKDEDITDAPKMDEIVDDASDGEDGGNTIDYEALIQEDLKILKGEFPELSEITHITELHNPMRYAALRDLGLTPKEAYLATSERPKARDNRSHLSPAAPRRAGTPTGGMTRVELERARELFSGMNDAEIQALYRRVAR